MSVQALTAVCGHAVLRHFGGQAKTVLVQGQQSLVLRTSASCLGGTDLPCALRRSRQSDSTTTRTVELK